MFCRSSRWFAIALCVCAAAVDVHAQRRPTTASSGENAEPRGLLAGLLKDRDREAENGGTAAAESDVGLAPPTANTTAAPSNRRFPPLFGGAIRRGVRGPRSSESDTGAPVEQGQPSAANTAPSIATEQQALPAAAGGRPQLAYPSLLRVASRTPVPSINSNPAEQRNLEVPTSVPPAPAKRPTLPPQLPIVHVAKPQVKPRQLVTTITRDRATGTVDVTTSEVRAVEAEAAAADPAPDRTIVSPVDEVAASPQPAVNADAAPPTSTTHVAPQQSSVESTHHSPPQVHESLPVAPAVPQMTLLVTGPRQLTFGESKQCTIVLTNSGTTSAHDVSVAILLNGEEAQIIQVGELRPGASRELPFELQPRTAGEVGLHAVATARSGAIAVARGSVKVIKHDIQMRFVGPRKLRYKQKAPYALTIENTGNLPAENIAVDVQLGPSEINGLYEGTLAPGGRATVNFQVVPREPGFQALSAIARGANGVRGATTARLRIQHAQLDVTVVGPSMKLVGSEASYKVHVKNIGDAAAENVLMTAHLPEGVKFRQGIERIEFYDGVTWRVGRMEAGQRQSFELKCELLEPGTRTITFDAAGDDGIRATEQVGLTVAAAADVQLQVTQPSEPVAVGEVAVYEIEVHNPAARPVRNVEISVQLDDALRAVGADGLPSQLTSSGVLFQTIGQLDPHQSQHLSVRVQGDRDGQHRCRVELSAADPKTFVTAEGTVTCKIQEVTQFEQPRPLEPAAWQQPTGSAPLR